MVEEWRDIIGYEGKYQVSNCGRVKTLNYNNTGRERIKQLETNTKGYKKIDLYKNGEREPFLVHRLVAIAFIPNPNNFPIVNHKDENPSNNCVDNLEWCDVKYNINYGTSQERRSKSITGGKNPKSKSIICIDTNEIFTSIIEASRKYNIDQSSITKCCKGKRKIAGGYKWAYYKGDDK